MKFADLKIGARLGAGIAALLALLILTAAMGAWSLLRLERASGDMRDALERANLSTELQGVLNSHAVMVTAFLRSAPADDAEKAQIEARFAASAKRGGELRQALTDRIRTEAGRQMLAKVGETSTAFRQVRDEVMQIKARNDPADASRLDGLIAGSLLPRIDAYLGALKELDDGQRAMAQEAAARAHGAAASGMAMLAAFAAAAIAVGVLLGWRLTRGITRPIGRAVRIAGTVAAGDLSQRIDVLSRDETGQLAQALRDMNDSLTRTVRQIRQGADAISSASGEIAAGNQDLSARTEQQAAALEETAATIEQLAATIKNTAESGRQARDLVAQAGTILQRNSDMMQAATRHMQGISQSSDKMSEIIAVIESIAFQTNILALNAAVEAARAGEQGRGFAVVAGEVRTLAQRSATAAKEIKDLISDSVRQIQEGRSVVESADSAMQDMVANAGDMGRLVSEIAQAGQEQHDGIEQITQAIGQIDSATQQNAALVEQAAAAASALQDQAAELVRAVGAFRLVAGEVAAGSRQGVPATGARLALLPAA